MRVCIRITRSGMYVCRMRMSSRRRASPPGASTSTTNHSMTVKRCTTSSQAWSRRAYARIGEYSKTIWGGQCTPCSQSTTPCAHPDPCLGFQARRQRHIAQASPRASRSACSACTPSRVLRACGCSRALQAAAPSVSARGQCVRQLAKYRKSSSQSRD